MHVTRKVQGAGNIPDQREILPDFNAQAQSDGNLLTKFADADATAFRGVCFAVRIGELPGVC